MKLIALTITIFIAHVLPAQRPVKILIPAGSNLSDVITPTLEFLNKDFKPGRLTFKDNTHNDTKLNYNMLNGEIMFINPGGDTLAIAKEQMLNINRVIIDTASFMYDKGYLQIVLENKEGSLAKKQQYRVLSKEKIGGYNMPSSTSSIDSYTRFEDGRNNPHSLTVRENITLQLKTDYYIGDQYNLHILVNKKNLEKIFFKKRDQLETYLKQHTVDFKNEDDLKALFIYLTETV
jgi:hypothetical protein